MALAGLGLCVVLGFVLHLFMGSSLSGKPFQLNLQPGQVWQGIWSPGAHEGIGSIIWDLRLPRVLACVLVGGILGTVGSAFQALFRNPLADPYSVGASSGAAVGGAIAIAFGIEHWAGGAAILVFTILAGMAALLFVLAMARRNGAFDTHRLLLAGVVVSAWLSSLVALVLLVAGEDSNQVLRWLLGSTTPMFWQRIPPLTVTLVIGLALLVREAKALNLLATGEESALRLGVNVRRLKPLILGVGTVMTAVAVGTVGIIGFLGLVAPHIARRIVGVDWRYSLLGSTLVGMSLLLFADIAAQWAVPGAEIPVGIVVAILGSPTLLGLLRRDHHS